MEEEIEILYSTLKSKILLVSLAQSYDTGSFFYNIPLEIFYFILSQIMPKNFCLIDLNAEFFYLYEEQEYRVEEIIEKIPFTPLERERELKKHRFKNTFKEGIPLFFEFRYPIKWGKEDPNQIIEGIPLLLHLLRHYKKFRSRDWIDEMMKCDFQINPGHIPLFFEQELNPGEDPLEWNQRCGAIFALDSVITGQMPLSMFQKIMPLCNPNIHYYPGKYTLVHKAFVEDRIEVMKCLIENGADVNMESLDGTTIFDEEKLKVAELVIKKRKIE